VSVYNTNIEYECRYPIRILFELDTSQIHVLQVQYECRYRIQISNTSVGILYEYRQSNKYFLKRILFELDTSQIHILQVQYECRYRICPPGTIRVSMYTSVDIEYVLQVQYECRYRIQDTCPLRCHTNVDIQYHRYVSYEYRIPMCQNFFF